METLEIVGAVAAGITAIAGAVGAVVAVVKKLKSGKSNEAAGNPAGDRVNIRAGRDVAFIRDSFNRRSEK